MKERLLLSGLLMLLAIAGATAQNIRFSERIPADAAKVLEPRLMSMLKAAGVADAPLEVDARVTDSLETSGSIPQLALTIELKMQSGAVRDSLLLKGVGADAADAWVRACKQFLPRSAAVEHFTSQLRREM